MWENRQLKQRSRQTLKANYWTIISLCFILTFFGIISGFSSSFTDISAPKTILENHQLKGSVKNDMNPGYTPGLVRYLGDYMEQNNATKNVTSEVLSSFKGKSGMLYDLMYRVDQLVFTHSALAKILIALGIAMYLAYYIFIKNTLLVGFSRFLIETRVYSKTKFRRIFFLFRKGGILNVSYSMIMVSLFLTMLLFLPLIPLAAGIIMCQFTHSWIYMFIGGLAAIALLIVFITQRYALMLVPFILAENPLMKRREVVALSRKMMAGNKLHTFGLELSFIGWMVLSALTLGLLSTFFLTPYKQIAFCELYMRLRNNAIDNHVDLAVNLHDNYLAEPPASLLQSAGISVPAGTEIYPLEYPYITPFKESRLSKHMRNLDPERKYTLITYILFFFIFSFIGWCWEVSIHLVKDGVFVNRGTMLGPWLPIYGSGGVMIIFFLKRLAKKPALLFVSTMVLCSLIEYFTSWYLETTRGMKWWDYSGYFLNINGRICLEGSLLFAIGGVIFVYIAGPMLDNLLMKFSTRSKVIACIVLLLLFGVDSVYSHYHPNSGKGITNYGLNGKKLYSVTDIYKLPGFTEKL